MSPAATLATVLFLALRMGRPLFLEGEAGVGKTEIAKVLAQALGRRLIRLQCYEGLDIASAVYEWNYAWRRWSRSASPRRPAMSTAHGIGQRGVLRTLPQSAGRCSRR